MQADYDATAPMQDILAQIAVNNTVLCPVQPPPAPVKYAFEERARIAQAFFDPPPSAKCDGNLDRQITIVDDLVSLCIRREWRPPKPRQSREDDNRTSSSDDDMSDVDIKIRMLRLRYPTWMSILVPMPAFPMSELPWRCPTVPARTTTPFWQQAFAAAPLRPASRVSVGPELPVSE